MPALPPPQRPAKTRYRQISFREIGAHPFDLLVGGVASAWFAYVLMATRKIDLIACDDAFITFQYARHLGLGHGLVFNTGERVWGFTSPLHTLVLGGATALGLDTIRTAFVLGFLCTAVASFLLYRLGARLVSRVGASAVALFFLFDESQHGIYALESNLLIVTQLAFLLAVTAKSFCLGNALAALACLARPDSLLLVVPVLLVCPGCRRPKPLLCFVAIGLAWESFAFFYFKSLLPQSLYAKAGLSQFFQFLENAIRDVSSCGLAKILGIRARATAAQLLFLSLGLLLLFRGARVRSQPVLWLGFIVCPWLLILAYSWIGSVANHNWELYSGRFMICASIGLALVSLGESILGRLHAGTGIQAAAASGVALLAFAYGALHARDAPRALAAGIGDFWVGKRYLALRTAADWTKANTPADASIALVEAGTLGYFSDRPIVDQAGIVTRGYLPEERMNPVAFLRRFTPMYAIVYGDTDMLTVSPGLGYERIVHFPNRGYAELSVLKRR
jgi:hypothetical protein